MQPVENEKMNKIFNIPFQNFVFDDNQYFQQFQILGESEKTKYIYNIINQALFQNQDFKPRDFYIFIFVNIFQEKDEAEMVRFFDIVNKITKIEKNSNYGRLNVKNISMQDIFIMVN